MIILPLQLFCPLTQDEESPSVCCVYTDSQAASSADTMEKGIMMSYHLLAMILIGRVTGLWSTDVCLPGISNHHGLPTNEEANQVSWW